jgi:hypothetical protein
MGLPELDSNSGVTSSCGGGAVRRLVRRVSVQDAGRVAAQEHGRASSLVRDADLFKDHAGIGLL